MLYATPIILGSYYIGGKVLRSILISQLDEQLNVQATVNAVNLNGLRTFPNLSLELTNVRIKESTSHYNQNLLSAQRVVVKFNPLRLLSGNNEIDKIELTGGAVRLYTDGKGVTNFQIFKTDSSNNSSLDIELKHVEMNRFRCIYVDESQGQSLNFETDKLVFSGKFKDDNFQLKTKGDGLFDHLTLGGVDYVIGKKIRADLALDIDQKINAYHIEKGQIGMDNLLLDVTGDVLLVGSEPDLDLSFSGNSIDIQSVVSVLPNNIAYTLRDLKSAGQIDVEGKVVGRFTDDGWPDIDVKFGFANASIRSKKLGLTCQKINLTGSITNPESTKVDLAIDLKELNLKKSSISGSVNVKDLSKPNVSFALKGLLDFNDIKGLMTDNKEDELSGKTLFNLEGKLPYSDSTESIDISGSQIKGDIEIRDAAFASNEDAIIKNLFGKARINSEKLSNVEIKGEMWHNDVDFTGKITNWQSYIAQQKRLEISGDLKSKYINLGYFIDTTESSDTNSLISIDLGVDTDLELEVTEFLWSNLKTKNLSGKLLWNEKGMVFRNLVFDAWGGTNQLDGELIQTSENFELHSTSISEKIALEELLTDFKNFDQTEFTPEILQGKLTTTVDLHMLFDRQFDVIEDSLVAIADMLIQDGRLKNYQTMESLSSFVDLEDLQDIKFKKLQNTIEIKERTIFIPSMAIENNAMNVEIAGTHNFDNYMNYRLKIRVTELLANKSGWVKRKKERQLEENTDGGLSAYILMVGTPDDLKIKYDRKAVKEKIKNGVKKERQQFFKDLKKELKREKGPTEDRKQVDWDEEQ
jgi:hypothetical protein